MVKVSATAGAAVHMPAFESGTSFVVIVPAEFCGGVGERGGR